MRLSSFAGGKLPASRQLQSRAILTGLNKSMPVALIDIQIKYEIAVGETNPKGPGYLVMNTTLGVPQSAGIFTDTGTQPIQPCIHHPFWRPGIQVPGANIRQWQAGLY
ncbi:MAG: hypothetical protein O6649_07380 [Gammaproteobacteria bacterium]|nr:hypothetical protein [Gammaproteobacteria bacterium]